MNSLFTQEEIDDLSTQVNIQLGELNQSGITTPCDIRIDNNFFGFPPYELPLPQRQNIEANVGEDADIFLKKFANQYICGVKLKTEKSILLEKCAKDLNKMGFLGIKLQILTVAITVYILYISLQVFTDKYCK